ncbi:MAG: dNTP triphosphohydrolase, partial [Myxococcales bacterium]|nr:dNTP triphosphohydrolase [Myxococcales bacterium]
MDWDRLLASDRLRGGSSTPDSEPRNEFERDYDRILFSEPFRRLMDKTQVFPMPENDHVHNRLIHSLEVASIGRSMGRLVGRAMSPDRSGVIGDVVASACLMHDLGNPPFGHAGEDAIASWFARPEHGEQLAALSALERSDLARFEGNAQSFRIVTLLEPKKYGRLETPVGRPLGLDLSRATLRAMTKYPWTESEAASRGTHKFGVYDDRLDAEVHEWLWEGSPDGAARTLATE